MGLVGEEHGGGGAMVICGWRDWWNLNGELVGVISELVDAADHIRMGAVCAGWKSAFSRGIYRPKVPPMLWLLMHDGKFTILDIFSGRLHTAIENPSSEYPCQNVRCGRWMVTIPHYLDDETLAWYPMTGGGRDVHVLPHIHYFSKLVRLIKTSSSSFILCHYPNRLSIALPGDAEWTLVGDGWGEGHDQIYLDAVSHGGCIYTLWSSGTVVCWDISTRNVPFRLSQAFRVDIADENIYHLDASDTMLMVLQSSIFLKTITIEDSSNKVFKLDFQTHIWKQLRSLGGGAIFFDRLHGAVFVEGRNLPDHRFRDRILLYAIDTYTDLIHDPRCSQPYVTFPEWKGQEFNQGRAIFLEHDGVDYIPAEYYDESLMLSYDVALGKFDPHYYTWAISSAWHSYGWFMPALP